MRKKCILKRGIVLIGVIMFVLSIQLVYATSTSDLNNQKKDLEEQKKEVQSELNNVTSEKSDTLKEIEKLMAQINSYETEIEGLDSKITTLNNSIKESQEKLDKATEEYNAQEELLCKRLVALYQAGETTYLDFILSSANITDFLSKYYLASELAAYDVDLLQQIQNKKIEIENAKKILENSKAELNTVKQEKQQKANELSSAKKEKDTKASKLSKEEKTLQSELEQIAKEQKEVDAKIKQIEQASKPNGNSNGSGSSNNPSAAGFIRPVVGYSITTGYGKYSWGGVHTGVDFSGSGIHNKPILAVKDGTVIISEALKNSSGNYYSYGEYIVIDHGDGLSTLYGHGEPGSRTVSVGNKVKQGQTIMKVGTTGNSTGYHLHFGVRVNGSYVNPTPYLP